MLLLLLACGEDDPTQDAECPEDTAVDQVNTAPGAPELAILPADPSAEGYLHCLVTTPSSDPDQDAVSYSFSWEREGSDAGIDLPVVAPAQMTAGETWVCTATPWDGQETGATASAQVTLPVSEDNQPPSGHAVSVLPERPTFSQDLTCLVTQEATDPEDDPIAYGYRWSVDGGDAGVAGPVVESDLLGPDQQWACTVTATDGADGEAVSDVVDILKEPCHAIGLQSTTDLAEAPADGLDLGFFDFTLELWIRSNDLFDPEGQAGVLDTADGSKGAYLCTWLEGDLSCGTRYSDQSSYDLWLSAKDLDDGQWHHVALVFKSAGGARGFGTLFVDGVKVTDGVEGYSSGSDAGLVAVGASEELPAAPVDIGPVRLSDTRRYSGDFEPQLDWAVDSNSVLQWLTTAGLGGSVTDEAGDDNDLVPVSGISAVGICD